MQSVSPTFNPYLSARWVDFRSKFRIVDITAAGDATPAAVGESNASQKNQTYDGIENLSEKWISLEPGGWILDGENSILPNTLSDAKTGFWSVLSDSNGDFSTPYPSVTYQFSNTHSSIGFTLCFDNMRNQYPKTIRVDVYNASNTIIATKTVVCTSTYQVVEMQVANYKKVAITCLKTHAPYQSVRIPEIIFGIVKRFDKTNITTAKFTCAISPIAETLPSVQQEITFDNSEKLYNMPNPSGVYNYLQDGQIITTEIGIGASRDKIEYVSLGKTYFTKSEAADDSMTAKVVSNDLFYSLANSICGIGTTGTWTLTEAVLAIISDSGQNVIVDIPSNIGARIINKCIPSSASHREALRLAAQAARCTCWFSPENILMFREIIVTSPIDNLDKSNLEKAASPAVDEKINTVSLTVKNEFTGISTVYTAQNISYGDNKKVLSIKNPLAYDGDAVAAWILAYKSNRVIYTLIERGNPARELADTTTIHDDYNNEIDAVITEAVYIYDGGLSVSSKARIM